MVNKITFVSFRGSIAPPPGLPLHMTQLIPQAKTILRAIAQKRKPIVSEY